jgi:hypothetical protein
LGKKRTAILAGLLLLVAAVMSSLPSQMFHLKELYYPV